MKLSIAQLRALIEGTGYAGSTDDAAQMLAHVKTCASIEVQDDSGNTIDKKALTIDDGVKPVVKKITPDPVPNPPADTDIKIKAMVLDELKKLGAINANRPALPDVSVKSVQEVMYEQDIKHGKAFFSSFDKAVGFADSCLLVAARGSGNFEAPGAKAAMKRLSNNPVTKAYGEATEAGGGALTWAQFIPDIIRNVVEYGVARKICRVVPMSQERVSIPTCSGFPDVYYPDENTTPTQTAAPTFGRVNLTAKMGVTLGQISDQLMQDSNIAIMDHMAMTFAHAFAKKEDDICFIANGEATYGGMRSFDARFRDLGIASAAGRQAGGGNWAAHTITHLSQLMGKLPNFARRNAKWVCAPEFLGEFQRIANAQGGVTRKETLDGGYIEYFMGYPVYTTPSVNSNNDTGTTTIDCYFGDFSRAAILGDRLAFSVSVSEHPYWTAGAVGVKGVCRHDVQVFDVGSTSAAGPVVYLYQT